MYPQYVDISSFQPASVDWKAYVPWSRSVDGLARLAVRASEGTVPATQGTSVGDTHYATYVSGIRAVAPDAIVIHYHYAYPQYNSPQAEVDWMASQVAQVGLKPQDIIMLDFEENVTSGTNDAWALAWLEAAKAKFGRTPVIYASLSMVQNRLQNSALAAYPLILADWTANEPPTPAPWKEMWAWQYTDSQSGVPGFGTAKVDANLFLHVAPRPVYTYNGMVISLQKSYQLMNAAESQDQCGPWTASELKYAGLPGKAPLGSVDQVHTWAVQEYTKYIGPDVVSDQNGSSIDNMHSFFHDAGYHWWDIGAINPASQKSHDVAEVIAALKAGYPVVVTVNEQSVVRPNGTNPYPWQPALGPVNHIFTIVGYTSDGYFLVDDELNAFDPSWPDKYSQSHLEIHWASVVGLVGPDPTSPWYAPIPSGDPLTWPSGFNGQLFTGETTVGIPHGWTDVDGKLASPNGHYAVLGFRQYILDHNWDPNNYLMEEEHAANPLEYSNPSLGDGQKQGARWTTLEWIKASNKIIEAWQGQEIVALNQTLGTVNGSLSAAQSQLAALQAQLNDCQKNGGGVPADLQTAVNQAASDLKTMVDTATTLETQLQKFVK